MERFYGPCSTCRGELRANAEPVDQAPPQVVTVAGLTTRRRARITPRVCAWVELDGQGVTEDGRRWQSRGATAGDLLDSLPADVQQVYVVGARPGGESADGFRVWLAATGERWREADTGHYLPRLTMPVMRFEDSTGRRVEVSRAASWYGEDGDYSAAEAAEAHGFLRALVAEGFGGAPVLATAATTGRDLWLRTVPDDGWPRLSDELCELIRSTSGQHRQEVIDHGVDEVPALVEVDGRWMYAALCRELPAGVPVHRQGEPDAGSLGYGAEQAEHVRARLRCSWTVPEDWCHVGLLPMRHDDEAAGWHYPSAPGEVGRGWLDGAEVQMARRWGWSVEVHEHIAWPAYKGGGPLDSWCRALVNLRTAAEGLEAEPAVIELVRSAVRSLLLHGLGAMHGRPHLVSSTADLHDVERIPADARGLRSVDGRWTWDEADDNRRWRETAHPELTAAVWARERVRMLDGPGVRGERTGALWVPYSTVVGFAGDALYLTSDPGWADDGRPGRLRTKRLHAGPHPAPKTRAALLGLLREVRA